MKLYKNINKKDEIEISNSPKSLTIRVLIMSTLIISSLLLYSTISIFAEPKTVFHNTQIKESVPHKAIGHESHQVVQFIEPKNNTLYKGIITFTSSIPIDIIAYHDITNFAEKLNQTTIKPWILDGKTFVPTTIMKNVTSGTVDFIASGITTHIPYNQSYDVVYSIHATPLNKTK